MFSNALYSLFRFYFWLCIALVGLYVVLSGLFYSIGNGEFSSFQQLVKTSPLTYIVVGSIVIVPFILGALFSKVSRD
jgi:hypothetical protein